MLQLILAIIMQNLSKIQAQEAQIEIDKKRKQVELDRKKRLEQQAKTPLESSPTPNTDPSKIVMPEGTSLGEAIRIIREAKAKQQQ